MPRHVPMLVWNGCCVGASCAWPQLEGVVTSGRFQIPGRTNLPLQWPGRHCAACPPLRVWVCPSVWLCVCSKRSVSWRCTGQPFAVLVKQWNYCIVLRFFCLRWRQASVRHKINPETGRTRLRYASECWVRVRVCTWSGEECRENFWSDYITAEHSTKGVWFWSEWLFLVGAVILYCRCYKIHSCYNFCEKREHFQLEFCEASNAQDLPQVDRVIRSYFRAASQVVNRGVFWGCRWRWRVRPVFQTRWCLFWGPEFAPKGHRKRSRSCESAFRSYPRYR